MSRVLILSDTHGRIFPEVLALAEHCDQIVHAGDIGNGDVLRTLCQYAPLCAVLGNNDYAQNWPAEDHDALGELTESAYLPLPGGKLAIEHGHRVNPVATRHAKLRQRHPEVRAVVYGHSHQAVIDQDDDTWVLNPGAAGYERTNGGPSCLLLDAREDGWQIELKRFSLK